MAEKLRYLAVNVYPTYHELVIQFADHGIAEHFGERLTSTGVAQRLRAMADSIERTCSQKETCPECFGDKTITMSDGSKRPCELCSTVSLSAREERSITKAFERSPRRLQETRTVWTRKSPGNPYCVHCGKTWDMHLCDGFSSCPTANRMT